jgi:hypothetical protein
MCCGKHQFSKLHGSVVHYRMYFWSDLYSMNFRRLSFHEFLCSQLILTTQGLAGFLPLYTFANRRLLSAFRAQCVLDMLLLV